MHPRHTRLRQGSVRPQPSSDGAEPRGRRHIAQPGTIRRSQTNPMNRRRDIWMPVLPVRLLPEGEEREPIAVTKTAVVPHHGPRKLAHGGIAVHA